MTISLRPVLVEEVRAVAVPAPAIPTDDGLRRARPSALPPGSGSATPPRRTADSYLVLWSPRGTRAACRQGGVPGATSLLPSPQIFVRRRPRMALSRRTGEAARQTTRTAARRGARGCGRDAGGRGPPARR